MATLFVFKVLQGYVRLFEHDSLSVLLKAPSGYCQRNVSFVIKLDGGG